jgi:D-aminopeptidase
VEVGHTTLISGEGKLEVGKGPVRTGVTAIHPRGKNSNDAVSAGWFTLNGNGEMTGTTWFDDSGFLNGPVMITNTHSVGVVRDAVIAWKVKRGSPDMEGYWWSPPVVAHVSQPACARLGFAQFPRRVSAVQELLYKLFCE